MSRPHWRSPLVAAVAAAGCDLNVGDGNFNVGLASGKATDTWTRTYTLSEAGRSRS